MNMTTSFIYKQRPPFVFFLQPSSSSSSSKPRTTTTTLLLHSHKPLSLSSSFNPSRPLLSAHHHHGGDGGGDGGGGGGWSRNDDDDDGGSIPNTNTNNNLLLFVLLSVIRNGKTRKGLSLFLFLLSSSIFGPTTTALAKPNTIDDTIDDDTSSTSGGVVWEVRGGQWLKLLPDLITDSYALVPPGSSALPSTVDHLCLKCTQICSRLMLPEGYPHSVTTDYLDYSLWRAVQGVASQITGVLATQSLLYAVGLGKGVIPTAAAINWVLKDGIGYLSKIFLSKYGRHFDVNPKGWRLFADLLENAAFGLEMLTPAFPNLFVPIGAAAGAGRSAAALIQAATRSCFYAGFAAQRNFAEVIAKGEAQGMVSKSIGIMLGIALANYVGSSTSLALVSFGMITWVHMYCNLKSYQCIQLRTFNPYRASLVFSEYLLSGQVPPVKDVNDEEPLFPAVPFLNSKLGSKVQSAVLTREAKDAANEIDHRLLLGAKLSSIAHNKQDALALFDLYKNEGYILTEHKGRYCVILKESCTPQDMLKSLFQANYLYWLESNAGIKSINIFDDCRTGGRLNISLEYVQREFNHVKYDWELAGWAADGLIARPSPNRIRQDFVANSSAS